ncbi:hypothetical protein J6590_068953 [Homalodisca vitripennis]|nr:hypothetical protein J6590_068953 [Homalodisca vitripennis]
MSTVVSRGRTACLHNATGTDCGLAGTGGGACILSGASRIKVLTANGLLPGPSLQVCEKDILVVDVVNRVAGSAVTVHWRGQTQKETPYMDGAAMVTQCPVNSFTTFQYKFRADNPGTHLWQVQTGNDGLDALFGALIVRQSAKQDPHHDLYDEDEHFVLISELPTADVSLGSASLLINGKPFGQDSQNVVSHLNVTANRRHRLRIAYAVTSLSCPISVAVESHSLLIIALDGHPIQPVAAESIRLAPGERVDAVLTADQEAGDYQLTAHTGISCTVRADASALLSYQSQQPLSPLPLTHHQPHQVKGLSTVGDLECGGVGSTALVCLPKIRSLTKLPPELTADRLDYTLYLPFDFVKPTPRSAFDEGVSPTKFCGDYGRSSETVPCQVPECLLGTKNFLKSVRMLSMKATMIAFVTEVNIAAVQIYLIEESQCMNLFEIVEELNIITGVCNFVADTQEDSYLADGISQLKGFSFVTLISTFHCPLYSKYDRHNAQSTMVGCVLSVGTLKMAAQVLPIAVPYQNVCYFLDSPHITNCLVDPMVVPRFNNLTFMFPSSPLLSQPDNVEPEMVCSAESRLTHCDNTQVCECVHVINIPLHTPVELVLIDQGSAGEHVFHIHGYSVHVVGTAAKGVGRRNLAEIRQLDRQGHLLSRNLLDPVVKDTVSVPAGGIVAVRFTADNPGYWLLHDERPAYWARGLGVILHVGGPDDIPPVPKDFPTCGSWVGPEFFLV